MITRIKSSRIICDKQLLSGYVYIEDGKIKAVTTENLGFDREIDVQDSFVAPGFIDIHTHGGGGHDFINSTEDVIEGCNFHVKHGTTSICPTISAAAIDVMSNAVDYIVEARNSGRVKSNILGAHLEGPYFSKAQCGAQATEYITNPIVEDYTKLLKEKANGIARWSYAPENDTDGSFCKAVTEAGIVTSAGHTNAIYDDMKTAIDNGCNLVTHLYSCTSTITRDRGFRRLGVIETAFLRDEMYVEIICDGKHLPPDLIKLILKIKGIDKVALVTDSLSVAGTDAKTGKSVVDGYIIEDGVCKLADRSAFAGSIATTDRLLEVMVKEVGMSVAEAVWMMTAVPAEIMKANSKGHIAEGYDADFVIFGDNLVPSKVFVLGEEVL